MREKNTLERVYKDIFFTFSPEMLTREVSVNLTGCNKKKIEFPFENNLNKYCEVIVRIDKQEHHRRRSGDGRGPHQRVALQS